MLNYTDVSRFPLMAYVSSFRLLYLRDSGSLYITLVTPVRRSSVLSNH